MREIKSNKKESDISIKIKETNVTVTGGDLARSRGRRAGSPREAKDYTPQSEGGVAGNPKAAD